MNFIGRRKKKPEVIIVSLIDIFAILLIFVIVTTTFKSEQPAVTIKLPDSKTAVVAEHGDEALRLSISERKEIFLGAKKVEMSELRGELEKLLALKVRSPKEYRTFVMGYNVMYCRSWER